MSNEKIHALREKLLCDALKWMICETEFRNGRITHTGDNNWLIEGEYIFDEDEIAIGWENVGWYIEIAPTVTYGEYNFRLVIFPKGEGWQSAHRMIKTWECREIQWMGNGALQDTILLKYAHEIAQ
jgi:hypothetical protein